MRKYYLFFFLLFFSTESSASIKNDIIQNLNKINSISFNFEQNINDKIETGNCTIKYPKKIYCKYNQSNKKILVSNGKSLVIKTVTSYYIYPLKKTPLEFILDKEFIINKINNINDYYSDEKFVSFKFYENNNEINIFFSKKNLNLVGWQTIDVYQNLSITYLSSVRINKEVKEKLFNLPDQN